MFGEREILDRIIPYRMDAVEIAAFAMEMRRDWDTAKPMKIFFEDKLRITGNSDAFINPAIECGLIHCRALLEFLGLKFDGRDAARLVRREASSTRRGDFVIERFSNSEGPLSRVTPEQAISRYTGPAEEAEVALAGVMHTVNKGLAHITDALVVSATDASHLAIASRGVRALIVSYLYTPLGLPAPQRVITDIKA